MSLTPRPVNASLAGVAEPGEGHGEVAHHDGTLRRGSALVGPTATLTMSTAADDRGHDHDPAQALELAGDPEAERGGRDDLGDVGQREPADPDEERPTSGQGGGRQQQQPAAERAQRQQAPDEQRPPAPATIADETMMLAARARPAGAGCRRP